MNIVEWSKSEVDYGRKLVDSAVDGALRSEGEFLKDESLRRHLERSALHAIGPTALCACLGWCGAYLDHRQSPRKALVCALVGGALGFGAGVLWENRKLGASVANGAWKSITRTRDARWFEKNPIDYA